VSPKSRSAAHRAALIVHPKLFTKGEEDVAEAPPRPL
jgi:hypothetical protein